MKNLKLNFTKLIFVSALFIAGAVIFSVPNTNTVFAATPKAEQAEVAGSQSTTAAEGSASTTAEGEAHEEDQGVIGLFGLDWKLFLAQLVNFAIVLFVLWRWVFKPVVSGMEARTKKIEDSLNTADQVNKDKEEFEQWKNKEMVNARHEATAIISEAKKTASETKDQILEQAKVEQQQILDQSKIELEQQKAKTLEEAKGSIADLVILSAEKLLRAKLDGKNDAKLISEILSDTDKEISNTK